MPKKARETPSYTRVNAIVSLDTAARLDEARATLKRQGVWVSMSAFVEIAIEELLARHDLPVIMRKHGARARRD